MKKINLLFILLLIGTLTSCNNDFNEDLPQTVPSKLVSSNTLPVSDAVVRVIALLDQSDRTGSRSSKNRSIYDVKEIRINNSRSESKSPDCYLFNFNNASGFAIVSANKQDSGIVYLMGTEGNLNLDNIRENSPHRLIIDRINLYHKENRKNDIENIFSRGKGDDYEVKQTTTITSKVNPIVDKRWNQSTPFNAIFDGTDLNGFPMGCVPVAIAQIIACHKQPKSILINGENRIINWTLINQMKTSFDLYINNSGAKEVSRLLHSIGVLSKAKWGAGATSVTEPNIIPTFTQLGYDVTQISNYNTISFRTLIGNLDYKRPSLVIARTSETGHAWVIDGYETELYTYETFDAKGNIVPNDILEVYNYSITRTYIHCNFGWGGYNNGMYGAESNMVTENYPTHYYLNANVFRNYVRAAEGEPTSAPQTDHYNNIRFISNILYTHK